MTGIRPSPWRFALAGAVLTMATVALVPTAIAAPPAPPVADGAGVPLTRTCDAIASNDSLTALVDLHYPNASLLPTRSVAEAAVVAIWGTVCSSSAFTAVVTGPSDASFTDAAHEWDKNRTASGALVGSLFVTFELTWSAACPSGSGSYPTGFDCAFSDEWTGNLSTGVAAGPLATVTSERFVACDTPARNQSDVSEVAGFYPNPLQQPNVSTAEVEVQTLWGAICSSSVYFDMLSAHPGSSAVGPSLWTTLGTQNRSGPSDLIVQWSIGWNAACSDGGDCYYAEEWTADLGANSFTGPSLTVARPGGAPVAGGSGGPGSVGSALGSMSAPWILTAGVAAGVALVAVVAAVPRRR